MLKQEYGYGCGLLSVANALSMSEFVTDERMQESKEGNNIMQLNKWLLDDGKSFQIHVLYFKNGVQFKTPKLKIDFEKCPNIEYFPVLITINVPYCTKNHMIALHINSDYSVKVLDSCEKEPMCFMTWDDFRNKYPRILSLEIFKNFDDKEIYYC